MEKKELREIICRTLELPKVPQTMENQITRYVTELGLSYKQIARGLVFFIDVEHGKFNTKFGLGIVPQLVERADMYYDNMRRRIEKQKQSVQDSKKYPDIILKVGEIRKRRKLPQIDIQLIEVD